MGPDVVLQVDQLSVRIPEPPTSIVRDVDLTLRRGEVLGVVGESGSGKTLTALAIMSLLPDAMVRSGRVVLDGMDLTAMSRRDFDRVRGASVGMVFQDPYTSLNPVMSVGSQITESIQLHMGLSERDAMERAVELLDRLGIPDAATRAGQLPGTMSGGMRQRVMLAVAIACDPVLLIADEPTSALDVTVQAQLLELLDEVRERLGLAVLLITHDLGVVAGTADRVAVMYSGRIVETGAAEDVLDRPAHPYTRALIAAMPRADRPPAERLRPIPGAPPEPQERPAGCPFRPRCGVAVSRCAEEEPPLLAVHPGHTTACWVESEAGSVESAATGSASAPGSAASPPDGAVATPDGGAA